MTTIKDIKQNLKNLNYKGYTGFNKNKLNDFVNFTKTNLSILNALAKDYKINIEKITKLNKHELTAKVFNTVYDYVDENILNEEHHEDADYEGDYDEYIDENILNEDEYEAEADYADAQKYNTWSTLKKMYKDEGGIVFSVPAKYIGCCRFPQIAARSLGLEHRFHPVKVTVIDFHEEDDTPYVASEIIYENAFNLADRSMFEQMGYIWNYGIDSDGSMITSTAKIIITTGTTNELINGPFIVKAAQIFALGASNCLLQPLLRYYEKKVNDAVLLYNKAQASRYNGLYNQVLLLSEIYTGENGVPQDKIKEICDKLHISIHIYDIFRKSILEFDGKCSRVTFKMINTKFNHVDEYKDINELVKFNFDTQEELQNKYNELVKDDAHFIYKRHTTAITQIITHDTIYELNDEYARISKEFTKEIDIRKVCAIDHINDNQLSNYLRSGCHLSGCIDYVNNIDEYRGVPLNDLDHIKSYTKFKDCKYYKGFMPKPSDIFRKIDIEPKQYKSFLNDHIGMYTVKIISFNDIDDSNIKGHLRKLKIYQIGANITLPCVEILFLLDLDVELQILYGCFSPKTCKFDFEFNEQMINSKIPVAGSEKGISYYAKWSGCLGNVTTKEYTFCRNDPEIIENMKSIYDKGDFTTFGKTEGRVSTKKLYSYWFPQVFAFITSYSRIQLLSQIFEFDYDDIIRVNTDGFYFKGEAVEVHNNFRRKTDGLILSNNEWEKFMSGEEYYIQTEDNILSHDTALHVDRVKLSVLPLNSSAQYILKTGCGGGGKTYSALVDRGYNNVCYVAPSYKLLRAKKTEFEHITPVTLAKLCGNGCLPYFDKRSPSVIICDEITQYTNDQKILIKDIYKYSKIIFCGDINKSGLMYQLPAIKGAPFKVDDFTAIETYNVNRRCKDKKLLNKLNHLRSFIDKNVSSEDVAKICIESNAFKQVSIDYVERYYNINDYILCSRVRCTKHKDTECNCDGNNYTKAWTDKLQNKSTEEKYYIRHNNTTSYAGDVVISETEPKGAIIRHAFTCHAIQGETIKGSKIYIDTRNLFDVSMLYTAVSRAEYWDQIIFIVEEKKAIIPPAKITRERRPRK